MREGERATTHSFIMTTMEEKKVIKIIENALQHLLYDDSDLVEMKQVFEQPTEKLKTDMFIMMQELTENRIKERKDEQVKEQIKKIRAEVREKERTKTSSSSSTQDVNNIFQSATRIVDIIRLQKRKKSTVEIEEMD